MDEKSARFCDFPIDCFIWCHTQEDFESFVLFALCDQLQDNVDTKSVVVSFLLHLTQQSIHGFRVSVYSGFIQRGKEIFIAE
jgi:hypothetical protein